MRRRPENRRQRLAIGAALIVAAFIVGAVTNLHVLEFAATISAMVWLLAAWFFPWAGGRYEP